MRKNGFVVMGHLLKLVTPLAHIMAFTITMGTLGFLAAIFIMVLGAMGLVNLFWNFDRTYRVSGGSWRIALFRANVRALYCF